MHDTLKYCEAALQTKTHKNNSWPTCAIVGHTCKLSSESAELLLCEESLSSIRTEHPGTRSLTSAERPEPLLCEDSLHLSGQILLGCSELLRKRKKSCYAFCSSDLKVMAEDCEPRSKNHFHSQAMSAKHLCSADGLVRNSVVSKLGGSASPCLSYVVQKVHQFCKKNLPRVLREHQPHS